MTPADRAALKEKAEHPGVWPSPWVAHTFEIDCPCPNGEHCGDTHSCEQVEAPEAYPASHEEPAAAGDGQCVVQISVPGLESLAGPTAAYIAAASPSTVLDLLKRLEEAEELLQEIGLPSSPNGASHTCLVCGATTFHDDPGDYRHAPGCRLAAFLGDVP